MCRSSVSVVETSSAFRPLDFKRISRPPQSAALPTFLKKFADFIVAERLFFVNRPRFALRNIRKKYDGAARCFADLLWRFAVSLRKRDMRRTGLRADQAKRLPKAGANRSGKKTDEGGSKRVGQKTAEGRGKQIRQKDRRRQGQTNRANRPPKAGR